MPWKIENFIKISLVGSKGNDNHSFVSDKKLFVGSSCNENGCSPYEIYIKRGIYSFECFGASGNDGSSSAIFGRGGVTYGMIKIPYAKRLFLYVGQKGTMKGPATFNGGGNGNCYSFAGGGATDVRLNPGEWNDTESLKSRIMVAAGGGGFSSTSSNFDSNNESINSAGGGLTGRNGPRLLTTGSVVITNAMGGSQEAGGTAGIGPSSESGVYVNVNEANGAFGIGGSTIYGSGGGGGGYFGGGAGKTNPYNIGLGAGGSSYISGYKGCRSVYKDSDTFETSSSPIHYSRMVFFNSRMSNGDPEESHNGEGKINITFIALLPNLSYVNFRSYSFLIFLICAILVPK